MTDYVSHQTSNSLNHPLPRHTSLVNFNRRIALQYHERAFGSLRHQHIPELPARCYSITPNDIMHSTLLSLI